MKEGIVAVVFLLIAFVGLPLIIWKGNSNTNKDKETYRLVNEWTEKLDEQVESNGFYKHHSGEPPLDPWGNKIHIHYRKTNHTETLTVRSAGRDGVMFSKDDVVERRTRFHSLGDHLKDAARGATQGVRQGLRK